MLASILGAFTAKQSGGSALTGALSGKAASIGLRTLGPVVGSAAIGYAAYRGWKKYRSLDNDQSSEELDNSIVNRKNGAALGSGAIADRAAA